MFSFRPISNLTTILKVIERLVLDSLRPHLLSSPKPYYTILHHLGLCALPMLRHLSFLAYTPNWPVVFFLLLLHPPGTHSHFQMPLESPTIQTHLVLLCCIKRLCILGPKGAIQICYYYYYLAQQTPQL